MNKSQRIKINLSEPNLNQYIKIKLEQDVDFLEFLTLQLKTKDAYRHFNSDYGVLVGRVIANNGVGVPNAKVSIFIPLNEEDEQNDEIRSIYPYKTPRDLNVNRKRYNLLPRVAEYDDLTGKYKPNQPFGSFPTKPEIITNQNLLNVYKKYYKFATTTNQYGDYMIFGAPTGLHTAHMSVDITDIGYLSMTPSTMVTSLGFPESLFERDGGILKIRPASDLEDLPHIETQEIAVNIRPFWGDTDNFEIGITRQDFRIKAELQNTFVVFGNAFGDDHETVLGAPINPLGGTISDDLKDNKNFYWVSIGGNTGNTSSLMQKQEIETKIGLNIKETIYYYPNIVSDDDIDLSNDALHYLMILKKGDYTRHVDETYGNFAYKITCNRRKVVFDDQGNEIVVDDSYDGGIYTQFRGFFLFDRTDTHEINIGANPDFIGFKSRIKVPQIYALGSVTPNYHNTTIEVLWDHNEWVRQNKTFIAGKIYAVSKFNPIISNNDGIVEYDYENFEDGSGVPNTEWDGKIGNGVYVNDVVNQFPNNDYYKILGTILKGSESFPVNYNNEAFGGNWLNFSLYLPNIIHLKALVEPENITKDIAYVNALKRFVHGTYFSPRTMNFIQYPSTLGNYEFRLRYKHNENPYSENNVRIQIYEENSENTSRFLRSDLHHTDFIEIPSIDIRHILSHIDNDEIEEGFDSDEIILTGDEYKTENDAKKYFYLGRGGKNNNCLKFLEERGLID